MKAPTGDAKKIVERFATALATAGSSPDTLRRAAAYIRTPAFSPDDDHRAVVAAFADVLERRAERYERTLRETYGKEGNR